MSVTPAHIKDRFSGQQAWVSSCLPVIFIGQLLICSTSMELPSRETKSVGSQGLQADLAWAASVSTCFPLLKVPHCIGSPSVRWHRHLSSFLYWGPAPAGSRGSLRMDGVGERERERKRETGRPSLGGTGLVCNFIFKKSFYTLGCT